MRFLLALLLACSAARADALTDLRTTLASVPSPGPVRAAVSFETSRGKDGQVTATVEDAPDGLHVLWPRAVVDAAVAEEGARAKDPNAPTRTRRTMDALNATVLNDYLNAAGMLLRHLAAAELVDEKAESWQGKPARVLTIKLAPPLSEKDRKYIKEMSVVGKIWIGGDGWPVAAEQVVDVKGRALLVISFAQHEKQEFRFARAGGRLVAIYHLKESEHSGGGEHGTERSLATLVPEKT